MRCMFYSLTHIDVRNMKVENNGAPGTSFFGVRQARFHKVDVTGNNLRAKPSKYTGHGGGFSFDGEDCVFTDPKFNNWGYGFREDVTGQRIVHERCQFNNNTQGIFYEISWGPILFKDCQINGNDEEGVLLLNVHNVTFDNTEFINNKQVALSFYQSPSRDTPLDLFEGDGMPIQMSENVVVKNCTFVGSTREQKLIQRMLNVGSLEHYHIFIKEEYTGENNRFYNPTTKDVFDVGWDWPRNDWADLNAWLKASGEKPSSTWAPPLKSAAAATRR